MGKKKTPTVNESEATEAKKEEKEEEEKKEEEQKEEGKKDEGKKEEEDPVVTTLKEIDDRYLAFEREYEKEIAALRKKYSERQQPLLEERRALLTVPPSEASPGAAGGTPALKGFWLQVIKHCPLGDQVEEWDEPVLEYLSDIRASYLDDSDMHKGFKLSFHFAENPYFSNDVLWKEYHTEESSPYTQEVDTTETKVSEIQWRPGRDVTVEAIKKKPKGGGAKKRQQKSQTNEEPRDSFFRNFFRRLKPDMPIPDDMNLEGMKDSDDEEEEDDDDMMAQIMEMDYEMGLCFRDQLVPFAIRWYTGEADTRDDDTDDDDEDDEEEDDDDDEGSSDDEDVPKKRSAPKGKAGGGDGKPRIAGGDKEKAEECKQQ